jgi:uncharacterized membrane protein
MALGDQRLGEGRYVNETAWDVGFLAFAAVQIIAGWLLVRVRTSPNAKL